MVAQNGDRTAARNALFHMDADSPERIWNATDWMRLVVHVLDLELEVSGKRLAWFDHWLKAQDIGPDVAMPGVWARGPCNPNLFKDWTGSGASDLVCPPRSARHKR